MTHPVLPIDDRSDLDKFLDGFATVLFECDCVDIDGEYVEAHNAFPLYEDIALARLKRAVVGNNALRRFVEPFVEMLSGMVKRANGDMFDAGWAYAIGAWSDFPSFERWTDDADDHNKIDRAYDYFEWFNSYEFWVEPDDDADGALMPRFDFH